VALAGVRWLVHGSSGRGALLLVLVCVLAGCGSEDSGAGETQVTHVDVGVNQATVLRVPKACAQYLGTSVALFCNPRDLAAERASPSGRSAVVTIERGGPVTTSGAERGIAQALGSVLSRGKTITVSGKDSGGLLFVHGRSGFIAITARFSNLGLKHRGHAKVTLDCHDDQPTVVLVGSDGRKRFPSHELLMKIPEAAQVPEGRAPAAC
jgi:hypothetical protein